MPITIRFFFNHWQYFKEIKKDKEFFHSRILNQDLSISIAEKVLGEELSNKGKQEKLVESMLDDTSLN